MGKKKVLFVCLGNICRSPAAEHMLIDLAAKEGIEIEVDSCGTGPWHEGNLPDQRMRVAAQNRGLSLTSKARCFDKADFDTFDYILAADKSIEDELVSRATTKAHRDKVIHLGIYSKKRPHQDILDPFHGEATDFETTLDQLEDAVHGFFHSLAS